MKNMGVDFLILEMMVDMEQMITTLDAVKKTKMPIWVGLTCSIDDKGGIYLGESVKAAIENGESLKKAVMYLNEIDVDAICIMHTRIKDTLNCLKELKKYGMGLLECTQTLALIITRKILSLPNGLLNKSCKKKNSLIMPKPGLTLV